MAPSGARTRSAFALHQSQPWLPLLLYWALPRGDRAAALDPRARAQLSPSPRVAARYVRGNRRIRRRALGTGQGGRPTRLARGRRSRGCGTRTCRVAGPACWSRSLRNAPRRRVDSTYLPPCSPRVNAVLGRTEEAFPLLERAFRERDPSLISDSSRRSAVRGAHPPHGTSMVGSAA